MITYNYATSIIKKAAEFTSGAVQMLFEAMPDDEFSKLPTHIMYDIELDVVQKYGYVFDVYRNGVPVRVYSTGAYFFKIEKKIV